MCVRMRVTVCDCVRLPAPAPALPLPCLLLWALNRSRRPNKRCAERGTEAVKKRTVKYSAEQYSTVGDHILNTQQSATEVATRLDSNRNSNPIFSPSLYTHATQPERGQPISLAYLFAFSCALSQQRTLDITHIKQPLAFPLAFPLPRHSATRPHASSTPISHVSLIASAICLPTYPHHSILKTGARGATHSTP